MTLKRDDVHHLLKNSIRKHKSSFSKQEKDFILQLHDPTDATVPVFYLLIKVHKNPIKGRPIAAAHSWITTGASIWLTEKLIPVVNALPTVLRCSDDLVNDLKQLKLKREVGKQTWLLAADIVSFYPSIPHELGRKAVKTAIRRSGVYKDQPELVDAIMDVLKIVLENNYVEFLHEFYHQIQGTAMGTNCAVVYANIVGWYIEMYPTALCNNTGLLQYYKRFVDDSFAVLQGTRQEVLQFIELLNSRSKTINFTFELSQTAVDFMDLTIFLDERRPGQILTK